MLGLTYLPRPAEACRPYSGFTEVAPRSGTTVPPGVQIMVGAQRIIRQEVPLDQQFAVILRSADNGTRVPVRLTSPGEHLLQLNPFRDLNTSENYQLTIVHLESPNRRLEINYSVVEYPETELPGPIEGSFILKNHPGDTCEPPAIHAVASFSPFQTPMVVAYSLYEFHPNDAFTRHDVTLPLWEGAKGIYEQPTLLHRYTEFVEPRCYVVTATDWEGREYPVQGSRCLSLENDSDAGAIDVGHIDSGSLDSGNSIPPDAGILPDSSAPLAEDLLFTPSRGCACTSQHKSQESSASPWLLALMLVFLRRKAQK